MRVYEIFIPELSTFVKFKVLEPSEVEVFIQDVHDASREEYMRKVLEYVVFNMKTEVLESIRMMSRTSAKTTLEALFNGCVMLNPGLDIDAWIMLAYSNETKITPELSPPSLLPDSDPPVGLFFNPDIMEEEEPSKKVRPKKLTKAQFANLPLYLKKNVIGQDEAIDVLVNALKRNQTGLGDSNRPIGVFLFCGSSGVGKSHLAKQLHQYLYGNKYDIVRIDCGEYQHKHENQKLIGSPPGYVSHDSGGTLTNQMVKHPQTVLLLDEVEKAHPDIWNTFLRIFDEGMITDNKGRQVSFCESIIIMTSNLGNDKLTQDLNDRGIGFGSKVDSLDKVTIVPKREKIERVVQKAIQKSFSPEFLNRIDKTIMFNYLTEDNYNYIADLEMQKLSEKLSKRGIVLNYDNSVLKLLVELGVDSIKGARGIAQVRREMIEDQLADMLLNRRIPRNSIVEIIVNGNEFECSYISHKEEDK